MIVSFPHFGIHVADIERSTRFYVDGLGFEPLEAGRTDAVGTLLGIDGATVRTQFIRNGDGPRIELWTVENREASGTAEAVPADRPGRPHLCFIVDDLDETAARIVAYGGQRLDESRSDLGYGELMFCADPDGTRIEIIRMKGAWSGYDEAAGSG